MKQKLKSIWIGFILLTALFTMTACGSEENPYQTNDADGYTVSIKYDANGGTFTTNTSVIVDSYDISGMKTNGDGKVEIALLSPDNEVRGNDAFTAVNNGYFMAGWYTERIESVDSEGNTVYTYSGQWDFEEDVLTVDPGKTYSAAEPVVTLYAAWVPLFEVAFYSLETGEYLESYTFNPMAEQSLNVPAWDEETGTIDMYKFPELSGYTFSGVYLDSEGTQKVETETIKHPGVVDYRSGTAVDAVMPLYIEWDEGEWYHIYSVEQFVENASVNGSYVLHADLDFTDAIWPTSLMYGNFGGTIEGNGHTIKNVAAEQTNNSKVNAGLFGYLADTAVIKDVTFENVTFTIKAGTRVTGTSFGLLAGTISDGAAFANVNILDSTLQIDSACYFSNEDYIIGLLCGMGTAEGIGTADIGCAAVGDNSENVQITVNENEVTVEFQ